MIATIDSVSLLEEAEALGDMVLTSDIAEHYHKCKTDMENDEKAQALIRQFIELKDVYSDVQRFGRYHPQFEDITLQMRDLKRALDLNDTIAAFKQAEEGLQALLNDVSSILAHSVSDSIKVPTGNPFFDQASGGCGSGGACGCG